MYNSMAETPKPQHEEPHNSVTGLPKTFKQCVQKYYYKSDGSGSTNKEKTNTRIADKSMRISGGTYHVPQEEYLHFIQVYHRDIFLKKQHEYMTEKQLESGGPIVFDLDFRYDASITTRQHSKEHIIDFISLLLDEFKTMYQPDDSAHIPFFVLEKREVNRIQGDMPVTKDGIHIIVGLQADIVVQTILRERILAKLPDMWSDLPVKNEWSDVIDASISKGHTNWQLIGSRKPGHEPYELVYVFDTFTDPDSGAIRMPEISPQIYLSDPEKFCQLSVRYREHPVLFMTGTFIGEYTQWKGTSSSSSSRLLQNSNAGTMIDNSEGPLSLNPINVLNVKSKEELDAAVQYYLETLGPASFELREAYEYTMALPKSYYGPGSFDKWIRVGWALRNIHNSLFIVWVAFSAQSDHFSYSNIRTDLWDRWRGFNKVIGGLTKRSIMYWLQHENPEAYKEIKSKTLGAIIDQTLENCSVFANGSDRRGAKGSGDYDIAMVLYHMYRDNFICVSVKGNIWYMFNGQRWEENDSGTTLRRYISEELRDVYTEKLRQIMRQYNLLKNQESDDNVAKVKSMQTRMETLRDIVQRLSKTNDKKNIMVEAKELFYNPAFLQQLDNNPYLLCFNNGVVDFKAQEFRAGRPEDYLSKCTNIAYKPLDMNKDRNIMEEVQDFMHKLFPCKELHDYMWDFLASTLIGNNTNQTFNMFIGIGQNGKSVLIALMELVLGEYKGDVPLTLLTQQRTKIGGLAPELVALKGVRFAVMQEPSKGDRINEGIMKQVTGGDPIQARAPYMPQMVNFVPQFKLVVCSNYMMELCSQDHGTRRRIRVVDFESLFTDNPVEGDPEKPYQFKLDKKIKEKFETWAPVFATMLVEHAYKTNGIVQDCARVMTSSNSYLDRQDVVGEFLTENTEYAEFSSITKLFLASRFKDWYSINYSGKPPNSRELVDAVNKRYGNLKNGAWPNVRYKIAESMHSRGSDDGSIPSHSADIDETVNLEEI